MITIHKDIEQRSDEWFELRKGRVGGSEAVGLTTSARQKTLITKKIDEILEDDFEDDSPISADMENGIELEEEAVEMYELESGLSTYEVGCVTNSKFEYGILSPDRLISDSEKGASEIKCPKRTTQIKYIREGKLPSEYKPQIIWYFVINEKLEWVDFFSYCPRLKNNETFSLRVKRDDLSDDIDKMVSDYQKFVKSLKTELKKFKK